MKSITINYGNGKLLVKVSRREHVGYIIKYLGDKDQIQLDIQDIDNPKIVLGDLIRIGEVKI